MLSPRRLSKFPFKCTLYLAWFPVFFSTLKNAGIPGNETILYYSVCVQSVSSQIRYLFSCSSPSPSSLPLILPRRKFRSSAARGRTMLAGVGGVESNFMLLTTPCITSHDHPDLPAILVYIECLCALEVINCFSIPLLVFFLNSDHTLRFYSCSALH